MEIIKLINAQKTYEMGDEILHPVDNLTFGIDEGKFVSIIGPSGSGKSTLLHIIGGLDKLDSGEISVKDKDLNKLKDNDLAKFRNKTIGFIFQSFNLQPHLNAFENVEYPLVISGMKKSERKLKVDEALDIVGLSDRKFHKPNQLSGGQQQRVSIARAIVNEPEIILADEPTGNLDTNSGKIIVDLLHKLNRESKITVIVVTHDNRIAEQSDEILRIQDGKLIDHIKNGKSKEFISKHTD